MILTANLSLIPNINIKRTFHILPLDDEFKVVTDWLSEGHDLITLIQTTLEDNKYFHAGNLTNCWSVIRMDVQCYTNHNIPINSTATIVRRALTLNNIVIEMDDPEHKAFWRLLVALTWFYVDARQQS